MLQSSNDYLRVEDEKYILPISHLNNLNNLEPLGGRMYEYSLKQHLNIVSTTK